MNCIQEADSPKGHNFKSNIYFYDVPGNVVVGLAAHPSRHLIGGKAGG